jgi:hypothetical protein
MSPIDDATLTRIERDHPQGLTSAEILELSAAHGLPLTEATLRKYVQLGLLPRSVRVGRKGKHQGSQGIYPAGILRQLVRIKEMMAGSLTIEQIQREVLFMRGDLQQLEQTLASIFSKLDLIVKERRREPAVRSVAREVGDARAIGKDLLSRLMTIENRLATQARMERAAAS